MQRQALLDEDDNILFMVTVEKLSGVFEG